MLHGTYGSATFMDEIIIHGNRYLFMVVFHPSHGQITINRIYLFIDISDIHESSTKSIEKQPNINIVISHFLTSFSH